MRGSRAKALRRIAIQLSKLPARSADEDRAEYRRRVRKQLVQYEDRALDSSKPTRRTRFLYECGRLMHKNLKRTPS
jgi:hypothetical protein